MSNELEVTTASLLKRIAMFLEDEDWESAAKYCDRVLDADPECAQAYIYRIMVDKQLSDQDQLGELQSPFDDSTDYKRAYKYGDDNTKELLENYNTSIRNKAKEKIYVEASNWMLRAKSISDYKSICEELSSIRNYKDASSIIDRAEKCISEIARIEEIHEQEQKKNTIYEEAQRNMQSTDIERIRLALEAFGTIPEWKDSITLKRHCEERIEQQLAAKANKTKKFLLALLALGIVLFLGELGYAIGKYVYRPSKEYARAEQLYAEGNATEASRVFRNLGGYKDSVEKYKESALEGSYTEAVNTLNECSCTVRKQATENKR